jgi:hypothetical protein
MSGGYPFSEVFDHYVVNVLLIEMRSFNPLPKEDNGSEQAFVTPDPIIRCCMPSVIRRKGCIELFNENV